MIVIKKPKGYGVEHYADLHIEDQKKWIEYEKYLIKNKQDYDKRKKNNIFRY